ncbi:hypothetical protein L6232_23925, partial [Shewanella sp. C31]|nr:hypothetical protein [Shewanella electrica]
RILAVPGKKAQEWGGILYLVPALLPLLLFAYIPLLANLALSLTDWNLVRPEASFVGLENYRALLADPALGQALRQSLAYMALAALGNFLL